MAGPSTLPEILKPGIHSARPAANAVAVGAVYACATHHLIYQSDGSTWSTFFDPSGVSGTTSAIEYVIDGGGSAITTGVKGDVVVPFACTITGWTLLADQSGSIVVNVWKDSYANFPPVVGDKITASAPPTISTATKSTDATLTGWTTSIAAGDVLRFNVDSATTVTRVTIILWVTR